MRAHDASAAPQFDASARATPPSTPAHASAAAGGPPRTRSSGVRQHCERIQSTMRARPCERQPPTSRGPSMSVEKLGVTPPHAFEANAFAAARAISSEGEVLRLRHGPALAVLPAAFARRPVAALGACGGHPSRLLSAATRLHRFSRILASVARLAARCSLVFSHALIVSVRAFGAPARVSLERRSAASTVRAFSSGTGLRVRLCGSPEGRPEIGRKSPTPERTPPWLP